MDEGEGRGLRVEGTAAADTTDDSSRPNNCPANTILIKDLKRW